MFIYGIHDACIFRSLRAHCTVAHNCRAACTKSSEYTSFGLVTVAPFTALVGGLFLTVRKEKKLDRNFRQ